MELNRAPDGKLEPLAAKNIDTGMGLERMAQILQVGLPGGDDLGVCAALRCAACCAWCCLCLRALAAQAAPTEPQPCHL